MSAAQDVADHPSSLPDSSSDAGETSGSCGGSCGHDHADSVPAHTSHAGGSNAGASWLQRRVVGAILFYQRAREGRPSPCRFFPSCSAYALEAVEVHGSWRGSWLSIRRLLRCRPLGPSGFDPVPEPRSSERPPVSPSTPVQKGG